MMRQVGQPAGTSVGAPPERRGAAGRPHRGFTCTRLQAVRSIGMHDESHTHTHASNLTLPLPWPSAPGAAVRIYHSTAAPLSLWLRRTAETISIIQRIPSAARRAACLGGALGLVCARQQLVLR